MIAETTIDVDEELLALEERARQLRDAKQRRRQDLQARLLHLQDRLSSLDGQSKPFDPNEAIASDARVSERFADRLKAENALRDAQRHRPAGVLYTPDRQSYESYIIESKRCAAEQAAYEARVLALRDEVQRANARYSDAVSEVVAELRSVHESAQQQAAAEAVEVRREIEKVETELRRATTP